MNEAAPLFVYAVGEAFRLPGSRSLGREGVPYRRIAVA